MIATTSSRAVCLGSVTRRCRWRGPCRFSQEQLCTATPNLRDDHRPGRGTGPGPGPGPRPGPRPGPGPGPRPGPGCSSALHSISGGSLELVGDPELGLAVELSGGVDPRVQLERGEDAVAVEVTHRAGDEAAAIDARDVLVRVVERVERSEPERLPRRVLKRSDLLLTTAGGRGR